ncbi:MAG TPA: hypothetical protein DCQ29_10565 [Chitinophagaceae bacterium]|nr:hypothetical protein [Chitinophagaceae bacterium]
MKVNRLQKLYADISSGLVVFLVALPLCLGIALASSPTNGTAVQIVPLLAGIVAGVVGGIVVGFLSGSQLSVSGPAAGLTAIVATTIATMPSFNHFLLAVIIAGAIQICMGFLKLGVIGDYVPTSVIKGMLAAIGIILILKQIPKFVGYYGSATTEATFFDKYPKNNFTEVILACTQPTPLALVIGSIGIALHFIWDSKAIRKIKMIHNIPAPLLVVMIGTAINYFAVNIGFSGALDTKHMVHIPIANSFQEFTSLLSLPNFGGWSAPSIWVTGATIAIVASLETLLSIEAADALDPYKRITPTNRELKAQGVGNICSGLLGGLPITSVVVRTSANVNAGAQSKLSAIIHGILLLLSVVLLPKYLNQIPLAALAAILLYTGYKLVKPSLFKDMFARGWQQFIPFITTFTAIILSDLLKGIMVGIGVGLYFVMRSNFKTSVYMVNVNHNYLVRLRKDVYYLNKPIVKKKLNMLPANAHVIIDVSHADFIDRDIIEVMNDFMVNAHLRNITVEVKRSPYKPLHQLIGAAPDNNTHH